MSEHSPYSTEPGRAITVGNAISLANSHLQSRRLGEAELIYRQVLAVNPRHFDALHFLGVIATQTGKFDQAANLIGQAIEQNPSSHAAHNNLGVALMQQGRLKEAAESFQRALAVKPDYASARINLGRVHQRLGNHGIGMEMAVQGMGLVRFTLAKAHLIIKVALIYMLDWFDILDWFELADAANGIGSYLVGA